MSEMPSAPVPESPSDSVFQTWRKALTQPSELTYAGIAASPRARATTAYLWVFVASLVQLLLVALVQGQLYPDLARQLGLQGEVLGPRSGIGAILASALCGAPFGAAITTLFFAVWVAVVQWLAGMFGGRGSYDQLAYALASIAAPYSILVGILSLLLGVPYVGFCIGSILFLAGFYILVLQVMAIKGVNQISWGAAIGSLLIPFLVVVILCACLAGLSIAALVPVIRETTPSFGP